MADRIIHIFIASASDSVELVEIARREIEIINNVFSTKIPISLKVHNWKNVACSGMGNPENRVLEQMSITDSNIFVEIFRFRFGSPTGNINADTGVAYKSGMEEEFDIAYKCWENNSTPDIIVLKSEEDIPRANLLDFESLKDIDNFFEGFKAEGQHPGLYNVFKDVSDFREVFRRNILVRVVELIQKPQEDGEANVGTYYQKIGLLNLFLEEHNNERNSCKSNQINRTGTLRLHARTGYSFISRLGQFNANINKALQRGVKFQMIMQNPWSLNAFYAARSEKEFKKQFSLYQAGKITTDDILRAFENSHWYKERYLTSIKGYDQLKKAYGRKIELRVSDMDLSNSILLTDDELFFEPYLNNINIGQRNIPLFELRASKSAELYKDAERDFNDLWSSSCKYSDFKSQTNAFRERLRQYLLYNVRRTK